MFNFCLGAVIGGSIVFIIMLVIIAGSKDN